VAADVAGSVVALDRDAARLVASSEFGAVVRPVDDAGDVPAPYCVDGRSDRDHEVAGGVIVMRFVE
jgi:hypothetical protein